MAKKGTGRGLGRENVKYVGIPTELWDGLSALARSLDRSLAWVARQAVQEYLARNPSPGRESAEEPAAGEGKGKRSKRA